MASALSQNLSEEESGQSDSELNSTEVTFKLPYEEVPARPGEVVSSIKQQMITCIGN